MSYILDALRRADAERERDPGRGIHAQPVALPAESARRIPLWIFAGLAGLVLLVAVALLLQPAPRVAQHLGMPPPNAPAVNSASDSPPVTPVASEVSPPAPTLAAARPTPRRWRHRHRRRSCRLPLPCLLPRPHPHPHPHPLPPRRARTACWPPANFRPRCNASCRRCRSPAACIPTTRRSAC